MNGNFAADSAVYLVLRLPESSNRQPDRYRLYIGVLDGLRSAPAFKIYVRRSYHICAMPQRYSDVFEIVWWAFVHNATDTIISAGPAEVAMMGMTYRMSASVAREALCSSWVLFSGNFLYAWSLGDSPL